MFAKKYLTVACLALALSGCVVAVNGGEHNKGSAAWEARELSNREHIAALNTGRSVNDVLHSMGTPDFDEKLVTEQGSYRVLYYRTHRVESDGMTTRDECTPLVFKDNALVGWGDSKLKLIDSGR